MNQNTVEKAKQLSHRIETLKQYLFEMENLTRDKGKLYSVDFNFTRQEPKGHCDTSIKETMPLFVIGEVGHDNIVGVFIEELMLKIRETEEELRAL